jgi:hypothetical protein
LFLLLLLRGHCSRLMLSISWLWCIAAGATRSAAAAVAKELMQCLFTKLCCHLLAVVGVVGAPGEQECKARVAALTCTHDFL